VTIQFEATQAVQAPKNTQGVPLRPIVSTIGVPTYGLVKHLAGLLGSQLDQLQCHVRNSKAFICTPDTLHISPEKILVSFDITSLFARLLLRDTLNLLSWNFDEDNVNIFCHVLTYFFCFNKQCCEQTDGVAMGSFLSLVIADFYMEAFEEEALKRAAHKSLCWFRYAYETSMFWSHGCEKLGFLLCLNSIHKTHSLPYRLTQTTTTPSWI
jgi:hypothetical protein